MRLVGADEVEDDVGAGAVGRLADGVGDVVLLAEHLVGAELLREPAAPLVGVDRDDRARAQDAHELQRDVPDAADADHAPWSCRGRGAAASLLTAW